MAKLGASPTAGAGIQGQATTPAQRTPPCPRIIPLQAGDRVYITDLEQEGDVIEVASPRSYITKIVSGEYRRNRRMLKSLPSLRPPSPTTATTAIPPEVEVDFDKPPVALRWSSPLEFPRQHLDWTCKCPHNTQHCLSLSML